MERPKWKQPGLLLILAFVVIVILMAQNFLLVRKVKQSEARIEQMYQEVLRLSMMNPGDSMSPFIALGRDSTTVKVNPAAGNRKTLMLVFTTWCHTCRENMDLWDQLLLETRGNNIQVLGLCLDSLYKINRYSAERPLNFPVYSMAGDTSFALTYKLSGVPQTILISEKGKVIKVWSGLLIEGVREAIRDSLLLSKHTESDAAIQATAVNKNHIQ